MNETTALRRALPPFGRFLLGVVVFFCAEFVSDVFVAGNPASLRFDLVERPLVMALLLLGFSFLLVVVDRVPGSPLASMGLAARGRWLSDAGWGFVLGCGMVGSAVCAIAVFGQMTFRTHLTARTAAGAGAVVIILAAGAMAEELTFRGYPFQRLVDAVGATGAVIVLSVLFGAAHFGNPNVSVWAVVDTVLVGVLLALAYLRTRSLWMPWGIHFAWNATLGLGFGLPVSGLTKFSVVVRSKVQGPLWLTGGKYGIEASAVGALVILAGIAALVRFVAQRPPVIVAEEPPVTLGLQTRE